MIALLLLALACPCTEVRTGTVVVPDEALWVFGEPGWLSICRNHCQEAGVEDVTDCAFTGWVDDADTADTGGYDWPAATLSCTGTWTDECPG